MKHNAVHAILSWLGFGLEGLIQCQPPPRVFHHTNPSDAVGKDVGGFRLLCSLVT